MDYNPKAASYDQRKRLSGNSFRAYSPRTADVSRGQPDTSWRVHSLIVANRETSVAHPRVLEMEP